MADESAKEKLEPKFVKIGNASRPLSYHPLPFDQAVAGLLKVKPPAKPAKK